MHERNDCDESGACPCVTWSCFAQAMQQAQAGVQPSAGAGWLPVLAQLQCSTGPASDDQSGWAGWCDWVSGWQGLQPDAEGPSWPGRSLFLHASLWAVLWVVEDVWVRGRRRGGAGQR